MDWQEKLADAHERDLDRLNDLADEILMEDGFNPFKPDNIYSAIADDCLFKNKEELEYLSDLMEKREITQLGRFVFGRVVDYWEKQALKEAESRLSNSWGGND